MGVCTHPLGKISTANSPPFSVCHRFARWGIPLIGAQYAQCFLKLHSCLPSSYAQVYIPVSKVLQNDSKTQHVLTKPQHTQAAKEIFKDTGIIISTEGECYGTHYLSNICTHLQSLPHFNQDVSFFVVVVVLTVIYLFSSNSVHPVCVLFFVVFSRY